MNNSTKSPKLTIVIPTRERSDTLIHTLRTIVEQDYKNLEILVSDNFSQDNTRQVVEMFLDSRIRYVNTESRLSMSDNWEFALSYVTGDFVTFIGDDDGFIPGAITKAMGLISKEKIDALVWQKIEYCWPDYIEMKMRNWISVKYFDNSFIKVKSKVKLSKVMKFHESYTSLPCLYNSIVEISKVRIIKDLSITGKFFNSISPDVYSGIALSKVIPVYIYTEYPFSINGASKHSNGTSFIKQSVNVKNTPAEKFRSENTLVYDERLMQAPSVNVCVMGEYLLAKGNIRTIKFKEPNWRHYIKALIRNMKISYFPSELAISAAFTSDKVNIKIKIPKNNFLTKENIILPQIGFENNAFSFIAPINLVNNVYDASKLLEGMLPVSDAYRVSPLFRFLRRLYLNLVYELKKLYKFI